MCSSLLTGNIGAETQPKGKKAHSHKHVIVTGGPGGIISGTTIMVERQTPWGAGDGYGPQSEVVTVFIIVEYDPLYWNKASGLGR